MRITRHMLARSGVIVALVGVEVWLAHSMANTPSIRAYVQTHSYGVASAQKGQIKKIDVAPGETVTQGQVIAELDDTATEAEIAIEMAERRRVLSEAETGRDALHAIDKKLEQLAEKRDALRLRAPADGVVESIDVRTGDAITPESQVATIVAMDTEQVVACVPEARAGEVQLGSTADVTPVVGSGHLHGVVISLTPAIAELPARCQPAVAKPPQLGRIAVIQLAAPAPMLPGQSELVAFGPRTTAPLPRATEPALDLASALTAIDVPPQLAQVSRFEASGLVWMPSLDRYIVVSDETGTGDARRPWLFAMSERGVLDPDPVVVAELKELDDVESIASDDAGGLWLLGSQSVSEKGHRPAARELLVHAVPEAAGFRADKQVRLATLLEQSGVAKALGVDVARLDIEGVAARNGALYLGLKAPADGTGKAMIWKVAAPDKLLAGDAAGAGISLWTSVALPVEADGHPVNGGIADLVFLTDDTLVVGATPSGIDGKRATGMLYLLKVAAGATTAAKLHAFPGLRPEGIAASPAGDKLVVVFDRGKDPSLWTQLDMPLRQF